VEDRGRKARKEDKKLSGERAIVTGTGTEIAEGSALPPAESTPKDVNAELSPFLDYILDCLDAKTAEEDDAQLKRLSGKLDSGNREKLRLICQACDAVTEVQRVTAAADVGAG
jgi:phage gp29-like protein